MAAKARLARIHAFVPSLMPSTNLLILKPFIELERRGIIDFDFTVGGERRTPSMIARADLIVFLRSTELAGLRYLRLAEELQKPVVYEIDDNFYTIPLDMAAGRTHRDSLAIGVLDRFVRRSTLVRVYSPGDEIDHRKCGR